MVLKYAVSKKKEKEKDYPWFSTQVNSASGQINVAYCYCGVRKQTKLYLVRDIKKRNHQFTNLKCSVKAREPYKPPFYGCIITYLSL